MTALCSAAGWRHLPSQEASLRHCGEEEWLMWPRWPRQQQDPAFRQQAMPHSVLAPKTSSRSEAP